jgi:hypothetical protein
VSEEPVDLPTSFVAPQLPAILCLRLFAIASVRRNQLDALYGKRGVQWIAVMGLVTHQLFRLACDMSRCESFVYKGDFMWVSRRNVQGERSTRSVRFALTSYSDTAMTLLPLPCLVSLCPLGIPTAAPLFRHHEGAVNEALSRVQEMVQEGLPHRSPK